MPFGNDPVASFLSRPPRQQLQVPAGFRNSGDTEADYTVNEPDQPEPASIRALRGTVFDDDPVSAWLAKNPAQGPRTKYQDFQQSTRRAFDTGVEKVFEPVKMATDYARRNTEMLSRNPEGQTPDSAYWNGLAAGAGEGVANMASPFNVITAATPYLKPLRYAGAIAQGIGSGFQAGQTIPQIKKDYNEGNWKGLATDAGMGAMSLLGTMPMFEGRAPSMKALEGDVLPPRRGEVIPPSRQLESPAIDISPITPGGGPRRIGPGGGGGGGDIIDGELMPDQIQSWLEGRTDPLQIPDNTRGPRQLPAGRRFINSEMGDTADALNYPADVGTVVGRANAPMTPEQFQSELLQRQNPTPMLGSIDDLLLSRQPANIEAAQPALPGILEDGGMRRPNLERTNAGEAAVQQPAPGPDVQAPARGKDYGFGREAAPGIKDRERSPGEEAGIIELENLLDARYGQDRPSVLPGKIYENTRGQYREPAAIAGADPGGRAPELPAAQAGGLDQGGSAGRGNESGRLPQAELARELDVSPADAAGVSMVDPRAIKVDPKAYQFKGGGDAAGVTDRLAKVEQWDPLAGSASPVVLHQRTNGDLYVVDGHQRVGLANRIGASGQPTPPMRAIVLKESDGVTVEEARRTGAMLNLQQGTGTATDIAKVLRERELSPAERGRIPKDQTSGSKLRLGEDLSKLSDEAFQDVINGQVNPNPSKNEQYAAVVGRLMPEKGPDQIATLRELAKAAPDSLYEAEQFVKAQQAAGFERATQSDMFGSQEVSNSLAGPIAKVMSATRKALSSEKSALGNAIRNEARLLDKGNVLNRAGNESGLEQATSLDALLDKYGHTVGPVRNAIKEAAAGLQRGEMQPGQAADRVMQALTDAMNNDKFQSTGWDKAVDPQFAGKGFDELESLVGKAKTEGLPLDQLMNEIQGRQKSAVDEAMSQSVADIRSPNFDPEIANAADGNYGKVVQPREGSLPTEYMRPREPEPTQSYNVSTGKLEPIDQLADMLSTGEKQNRLPGDVGNVRDTEIKSPAFDAPFSLAAEPATRTPAQPGLQQLEQMLDIKPQPSAEQVKSYERPVPSNVESFLTKQLGYSREQVAAMGADEAIRIGKERVPNPEPPVAAAPPKIEPLPEKRQLPSMQNFDELRQARGQQRKVRLDQTRVEPGARALEAPAKIQQQAREQLTQTPEPERPAGLSARERGESPRQVTQRAQHMETWLSDPTPENFTKWVKEAMGQAERVNEKQLRAGTSKENNMPAETEGGTFLASGIFPGAQLLANPKAMKAAAKLMLTSPSVRAALGAGIGYFGNDDPLQGAAMGALIGAGLNKKLATETLKFLQQMVSRTAGGLSEGRGVKPVVRPSNLAEDLHPLQHQLGSPMRAIPEQFMKAQKELDSLDQLFHGRDPQGKPMFVEDIPKNAAERAAARKVYVGEVIADLRKDAAKFHEQGQHRRAEYIDKIVDVLKEKPPALNRMVKRATGTMGEKAMNQLVRHMYRLQLGANMGVGLINRTQKWYALRRVPYNYITSASKWVKTEPGKAATDFLKLDHPTDSPESFSAETAAKLNRADEILQSPLRAGDITNRRIVYAAARKYATDKGGVDLGGKFNTSEEAVHQWAMDVVNETQTLPGALGQNPFMRDLGAFSAYTKYPTMWAELMLDSMRNPDQRSVKMLAMMAGATGVLTTMGVSALDLLLPRLIPGLGVGRAVVDAAKHIGGATIGSMPDHSLKDDLPGMAIPGYLRKFTGELEAFGKYGAGDHEHLTASGNIQKHSGFEALENLVGITSTRQASERSAINEEMQRRNQREIDQKEKSRAKREAQFERGNGKTLPERLRQSTPLRDRREFDQRFPRGTP